MHLVPDSDITPDHVEHDAASDSELAVVTEALLFASSEPLRVEQIAAVYARVGSRPEPSRDEVGHALNTLNEHYEATGRAFRIEAWAGGYRLATVSSMAAYVEELRTQEQPKRLSRSLLETLAIVAYKQPVSKTEVDFVRGVDSDYAIRKLLEHGLIDVVGRSESLGRPLLYGTTPHFLDQFGLHSLEDLPKLREIEELMEDATFNREKAKLLFSEGVQLPTPQEGE